MAEIIPILLAGGSGTRLWPLSRKSYPKQFVPLTGEQTLFQESVLRMTGEQYAAPIVITNSDFRFIVTEQLQQVGVDPGTILIEPEGRNTAPAVLAAALYVARTNPEAILLVAPSDHVVTDKIAFQCAVTKGLDAVGSGKLVTFGIAPSRPETGYGYLELATKLNGNLADLKRFVEKPNLECAAEMIKDGSFLWNAGIFLFKAKDIIDAFEVNASYLINPVSEALDYGHTDLGFYRLEPDAWARVTDISIDYAVMEKADNLSVVRFDSDWSDLGDWEAVWRESSLNDAGVATSGEATAIDCTNSLLRSENEQVEVVGIGLNDTVVIATNDAVLVVDMSRTQDVKKAVDFLKVKNAAQATRFPKDHRPWGWFESIATGNRFQVKRIHVHPGAALSLQSHNHRAEHWIVVIGTAEVTIDGKNKLVSENESVYIPLGAVHRLKNPGKIPMVLVEVQTGSYLGEDDIVRLADVYERGQGAKG